MARQILQPVFICLVCLCLSAAAHAGDGELTVKADVPFGKIYRPGSPLPVRLTFLNDGDALSGDLTIEAASLRYHQHIDLPSPTTRAVEIDAIFFEARPALAATIRRDGRELFAQRLELDLPPPPAHGQLAIGVLGTVQRFRDLRAAAAKATWCSIAWLPEGSPDRYEALDLIVVDASRPRQLPRPPRALEQWLACGGRIFISLPQEATATGPWVDFVRSNRHSWQRHPDWPGLNSFSYGLGRVAVVSFAAGRMGDPARREQLASAIVEELQLRSFPRMEPVQPQLYAALRPVGWGRSALRHLAGLLALYVVLMAVVLVWRGSQRRTWIMAGSLSVCAAAALAYLLFVARSPLASRSFALLHARAGGPRARLDVFTSLGTARRKLHASVEGVARPLLYDWSDIYNVATDVRLDEPLRVNLKLSRNTWRCFASWRKVSLGAGFIVEADRLLSSPSLAGEPLVLQDAIVTDGRRASVLSEPLSEAQLHLSDDPAMLSGAIFAALGGEENAGRRKLLQWWAAQRRANRLWLLGWARMHNLAGPFKLPPGQPPMWLLCTIEIRQLPPGS